MRPRSESGAWLDAIPMLTTLACAACGLVYLSLQLSSGFSPGSNLPDDVAARYGLLMDAPWAGKPWSLLSSVFVHFEFFHIAFNVYWLWILGGILEHKVGSLRWLAFFVGAAWVSSALQLLVSGNAGIGMSGVGYALFGFGWVARPRMPEFSRILDNQTVMIFVLWLVGCAVATQFGWVHIANMAHLGGLAFGAAVAGLFVLKWKPWATAPALAALAALSVLPLFWCPTSFMWNAIQADDARDRKDYAVALVFYKRALPMSAEIQNKRWALSNLALIYVQQKNLIEAKRASDELAKIDQGAAPASDADSQEGSGADLEIAPKPREGGR